MSKTISMTSRNKYKIAFYVIGLKASYYARRLGTDMYLCRDGKFRDFYLLMGRHGIIEADAMTYFSSKLAATRKLGKYLRTHNG